MMALHEMITVLQAAKEDRPIQFRSEGGNHWYDTSNPSWDFSNSVYRVKPEPRECWVNKTSNGFYGYSSEDYAFQATNPDVKYDGIAIHMREVMDDGD